MNFSPINAPKDRNSDYIVTPGVFSNAGTSAKIVKARQVSVFEILEFSGARKIKHHSEPKSMRRNVQDNHDVVQKRTTASTPKMAGVGEISRRGTEISKLEKELIERMKVLENVDVKLAQVRHSLAFSLCSIK
jgi:hypothetical protein